MPAITFRTSGGVSRTIEAAPGVSVMQAARAAGIDGIVAECGGDMVCASCHVFVAPEFIDRLPPTSATEADMLDFTSEPRQENSRLSCQIRVSDALDGLVLELPKTQV